MAAVEDTVEDMVEEEEEDVEDTVEEEEDTVVVDMVVEEEEDVAEGEGGMGVVAVGTADLLLLLSKPSMDSRLLHLSMDNQVEPPSMDSTVVRPSMDNLGEPPSMAAREVHLKPKQGVLLLRAEDSTMGTTPTPSTLLPTSRTTASRLPTSRSRRRLCSKPLPLPRPRSSPCRSLLALLTPTNRADLHRSTALPPSTAAAERPVLLWEHTLNTPNANNANSNLSLSTILVVR